jgi:uncharacterized protein YdhG (YjbR/CyaY superfamily)
MTQKISNVDDYINTFPEETQAILQKIRQIVHEAVPDGEEVMSYGIPTIKVDGKYVVYFSGWKHHVSLYPTPDGDAELDKSLEQYKAGKGTLKFPLDEPIPYDLIAKTAAVLRDDRSDRY